MTEDRVHFIDWMKAVGMFIIVFGHVFGPPFNQFTQPIYPKQLGVVLFVFAMGWSLANDKRNRWQVVYNRLFPVYLFGLGFAMFMSFVIFLIQRGVNPSNYLPFIGGVNVLVNYFPANPTTWYIGTYIHLVLIWAFIISRIKVTIGTISVSFLVEIVLRYAVLSTGNSFIAYMLFPNWITIFLLGFYCKDKKDVGVDKWLVICPFIVLSLLTIWAVILNSFNLQTTFPFKSFPGISFNVNNFLVSLLVSILYFSSASLSLVFFRRCIGSKIISFFARNTLFVFIAHMPLVYLLAHFLYPQINTVWVKKSLVVGICFIGLSVLSEVINRYVKPKVLGNVIWEKLLRVSSQSPSRH